MPVEISKPIVDVDDEFKASAYGLATTLGCQISGSRNSVAWVSADGVWSSGEKYARMFPGHFEAAIHFLSTPEAKKTLKALHAWQQGILHQCTEAQS
jgi:hypothetical protein